MSFVLEKEEEMHSEIGPSLQLFIDKKSAKVTANEDCVFLVFDQIDLSSVLLTLKPRISKGQIMQNLEMDVNEQKTTPLKSQTVRITQKQELQDSLI